MVFGQDNTSEAGLFFLCPAQTSLYPFVRRFLLWLKISTVCCLVRIIYPPRRSHLFFFPSRYLQLQGGKKSNNSRRCKSTQSRRIGAFCLWNPPKKKKHPRQKRQKKTKKDKKRQKKTKKDKEIKGVCLDPSK
jgi:hypothetical protein